MFLENAMVNLPDSKFSMFIRVSSFQLDYAFGIMVEFKPWHHDFLLSASTFLQAIKDPRRDVMLITFH